MDAIILGRRPFDYKAQEFIFDLVFKNVERVSGESAFCKFKNDKPVGGLAPAYFEAIVCAFARAIESVEIDDPLRINRAIIAARQSDEFRQNVGTGANKRSKLDNRIKVIEQAIRSA